MAVSGCTSSGNEKTNSTVPSVTLSNFTAKGVTFEYPSDTWTCVEGSGNTIAELTYKNGDVKAYVKKYPGTSLETLKADILSEAYQDTTVTEMSMGRNMEYKGYTINSKAESPYNMTEDYGIFETGGTAYELSVSSSDISMEYVLMYIENSIQIT